MKIKYATVLLLASALPFLGLTGRTTLTPSQPSGAQGDVVNVEVHFSSDTTEVVGAQFTLTYDPAVMTAGEISTGTAVSNHEVFDEQSSGKISVTLLSMSNAVFTTGTLATISFTLESAVSETTSSVSLVDAETLLVTKAGAKESYEAIQKINDLFLQYAAQGEASKPSTARSITFSATGDGSDASYLWDFGDGTTMTGKDASHVYKTPSSYLITMTATNFLGSKTSSKRVTVEAPYWALDATDLGLGWKSFDWFGKFYQASNSAWMYHEKLGWLYRHGETVDDTWLWSERWKWTWTGDSVYPFLANSNAIWLYYFNGTTNPVRYYDYGVSQWLSSSN